MQDIYPFEDPKQSALFGKLTKTLRCSVCQNQSVAESNSDMATEIRQQIYIQILEARSEKDIVGSMVEQFGSEILYQPPFQWSTIVLWLGPVLMLCLGGLKLMNYFKTEETVN